MIGPGQRRWQIRAERMTELSLEMEPQVSSKCSIQLISEDLVIEDVEYKIYFFPNGTFKLISQYNGFRIEMNGDILPSLLKVKVLLNVKNPTEATTVNKCYQALKFFYHLVKGDEINIYDDQASLMFKQIKLPAPELVNIFLTDYEIYEALKGIEKAFGVRFNELKPNLVTDEDIEKIFFIDELIKKRRYATIDEQGIIINNVPGLTANSPFKLPEAGMLVINAQPVIVNLFNTNLDLGREQIIIPEPEVVFQSEENRSITIKDKKSRILKMYEKLLV